jgi:hypothetical protein
MEERGTLIMLDAGKQTIFDVPLDTVAMNTEKPNSLAGNPSAPIEAILPIDEGKQNVLGVRVDAVDYEARLIKLLQRHSSRKNCQFPH